jgi:hypothetical protein
MDLEKPIYKPDHVKEYVPEDHKPNTKKKQKTQR